MRDATADMITYVMAKNHLTGDSPAETIWDAFFDQWQDDHNNHNDDNEQAAQWADKMTTETMRNY